MTLSVQELVAALPLEAEDESSAERNLRNMLANLSAGPVPTGLLHRLWCMGSVQGKVALAYLVYWIRGSYAASSEKDRLLNETRLKAAMKLLAGMSYLRGIAMKLGQTLANYPNVLPQEYADVLGKLNFQAPPMHYALLREHVRNELGGEPEDVFADFQTHAFAAASLGQVHRARLKNGEEVAVKIQYPGIARTIDADFRALLAVLTPMRLTAEWDSVRRMCDDVRQMLHLEADYRCEAHSLQRARLVFREDEAIVIPRVHEQYTTNRILTMDYLDGVHIDEYLKTYRSQEERDRYGELMMRASFRMAHKARLWYADSNPGNYLFLRDGRLGVIDFGCCRDFTPQEWDYYVEMGRAHRQDAQTLRRALLRAVDRRDGETIPEEHMRLLEDMAHWYSDYLLYDGPFDFGDEAFLRRGVELIARLVTKRYVFSLPVNTWITRQLIGLRCLAFRLKARINMKKIDAEESQGVFC